MSRLLAIGDIHGCNRALIALLEAVDPGPDDTLITLGDYVDRGSDSRGVIETLINLRPQTRLITLCGNHELMMLTSRDEGGESIALWMINGGDMTVDSYRANTLDDIPSAHWDFLRECKRHHETEHHLFAHACLDPDLPLNTQPDEVLFWEHLSVEIRHKSGKQLVCGHTPQRSGLPWVTPGTVCLDTAACRGGWLTCADVLTGHCWQSNQGEQVRELQFDLDSNSARVIPESD